MNDKTALKSKSELLRTLTEALQSADALAEIDVAIRISEAIDLLHADAMIFGEMASGADS